MALCQAMTRIWSQLWNKGESESVTNCHRLELPAEDGKMRLTGENSVPHFPHFPQGGKEEQPLASLRKYRCGAGDLIDRAFISEWQQTASWPQRYQVEQDLVICRALVEIFNHPALAENLAFRGGNGKNETL